MPEADLVLKNARVITLDPSCPAAGFVAVRGERILHAGDRGGADSFTGPGTKVIDCEGRTVVPGFNDAHCHIFSFLRTLLSVDLSSESVKSIADIKKALKDKAAETPPGTWITGTDYNDFYLEDKRHPTRRDIDEVSPDHPVVLSHRSLHACVLNSRALALAGITRESEEPPGGTIEREFDTGEPSGVLLDMLGYIRESVMPRFTDDELERAVRKADRQYLSLGITSLQDATVVNDIARWRRFERFKENGTLRSRVYLMPGHEYLPEFVAAGLTFGCGDPDLRLGHVKITPSESDPNTLYPSPEELAQMVFAIHRAGFRAAIHAVRMETIRAAVDAIESALKRIPVPDHRHRIEHGSESSPDLLKRIRENGIFVVSQPPFLYYSGERYLATVPPERQPWLYRFRSMIEAGIDLAGSSDSPVVSNDPLRGLHSAVLRQAISGQVIRPEERLSPFEALKLYTASAARASFEEHLKGTISEGKLADLAILSDDPLTVPPEDIKNIRVERTIIGGTTVWEA